MQATELFKLEYLNDQDMAINRPTKQLIKEVPFIQNNPRYKATNVEDDSSDGKPKLTEKQKRIAALKAQLLAPQVKPKPKQIK